MTTLALTPLLAADNAGKATRLVLEIMATPDKGIPEELLEDAHCIVIVPDLKTAAFVVGGKYGKRYLFCGIRAERVGLPPPRSASKA